MIKRKCIFLFLKMSKAILLVLIAFTSSTSWSQDPTFTQFYSNPLYLNPALAGATGCPRISLNYRNEWPQLTGNYVTYSAAYDSYVKDIKGGVGVIAMYDQQAEGTISTTMLGGIYSYNLKIKKLDQRSLSIFHKSLKPKSHVKITNPLNNKSLIAEIKSNRVNFSNFFEILDITVTF